MSVLVNCICCQGHGKKITPEGRLLTCWICDGTRTQAFDLGNLNHDLRRRNDRLSRYNQNCHWKSFTMDRNTLRGWAREKRRGRVHRKISRMTGFNFPRVEPTTPFLGVADFILRQAGSSVNEVIDELVLSENYNEATARESVKMFDSLVKPPWEK